MVQRGWSNFRRDEQLACLGCILVLALCVGINITRSRAAKPLPPIFQQAPNNSQASKISSAKLIQVHVAGAVNKPGVYQLPLEARVTEAISRAGGAKRDADLDALNLAAKVQDGQQIKVVTKQQRQRLAVKIQRRATAATTNLVYASTDVNRPKVSKSKKSPAQPLNLNTASAAELETLPGIGPALAQRILEYRQQQGAFKSIQDLDAVKGIGSKKLEKLKDYVTF